MNWRQDREISDAICKLVDATIEATRHTCSLCKGDGKDSIYSTAVTTKFVTTRTPGDGICTNCGGTGDIALNWWDGPIHAGVLNLCIEAALAAMGNHNYQRATMFLLSGKSWVYDALAAGLEQQTQEERDQQAEVLRKFIERATKDDK